MNKGDRCLIYVRSFLTVQWSNTTTKTYYDNNAAPKRPQDCLRMIVGVYFYAYTFLVNERAEVGIRYDISRTHPGFVMKATPLYKRTSQRLTFTMSWGAFQRLNDRATREGRSLSNLVSYLVERSLCDGEPAGPVYLHR